MIRVLNESVLLPRKLVNDNFRIINMKSNLLKNLRETCNYYATKLYATIYNLYCVLMNSHRMKYFAILHALCVQLNAATLHELSLYYTPVI